MSQYGDAVNPYAAARSPQAQSAPALPAAANTNATASAAAAEPEVGPPCLSIAILRWHRDTKEPVLFGGKVNLEQFPKMQQGGLRQFLKMISRAVVKNAKPEVRHMVEVKEYGRYRCFYYLRTSGIAAVMVTQSSYKVRLSLATCRTP